MMNRKNTILIAVLINTGLLAVLLIAALTLQEEPSLPETAMRSDSTLQLPPQLPKFEESINYGQTPLIALGEPMKQAEIPLVVTEEPLVHKLPPLVPESAPAPLAPPPPAALSPPLAPLPPSPDSFEIVVKKGDSLEKIAKAHRTSVDEIIKVNHLPSSFLKVGQVLKIPTERSLASASSKGGEKKGADLGPEYYTMKVGDNPWAIAMKHHMKVEELLRLNGLNEERARKLKPGDRLRIR